MDTPVVTPGVAANPVFFTSLVNRVTNHRDFVVNKWELDILRVDSSGVVVLEVVGGMDTARDGTILKCSLHVGLSLD
jgi:hypothetical protein